jgi:hypothetical protein
LWIWCYWPVCEQWISRSSNKRFQRHSAFAERTRFQSICPHRLAFGRSHFLSSHGSVSLSLRCPMLSKFSLSVFQLEAPGLAKNLGVRLFRRQSRLVSKRRGNMSTAILIRRRPALIPKQPNSALPHVKGQAILQLDQLGSNSPFLSCNAEICTLRCHPPVV